MANVLILGGGFGGLIAAEKLAAALSPGEHRITLVSRRPEFVFYPALVQTAFGQLSAQDVTFDLQSKLASFGVRFVLGEVINIDAAGRRVRVAGDDFNGEIRYDYLIVALGRRLATEKTPGFFEHAHHVLGITAAQKFGAAVDAFQAGRIVVGMCPDARLPVPVCETAFALARKFETAVAENRVSIGVVFPETVERAFGGAQLQDNLKQAFDKHRIELVTDFPVTEIAETEIRSGERSIGYGLLMLVPPFRGQVMVKNLGAAADDGGYARVNEFLQIADLAGVYAVGDAAGLPGPKLAHMAVEQGKIAAANVFAEICGDAPNALYRHEIAAIIDQGGSESIYLHYGIWDETLYRLKSGALWSWVKNLHDKYWQRLHF